MAVTDPALPASMRRLSRSVERAGLDALVLLSLENVQFAAAAPLRSASPLDRPNVVLVQTGDRGIIFTSEETVPTVRSMVASARIVGYDERGARFPTGILDRVVATLRDEGLERATLGYESDRMP